MTIFEMLEQSGVLTVLGMAVVFGFLVIMVIAVTIMGKIVRALNLDSDLKAPAKTQGAPAAANTTAAVTAAISAAVNEHRAKKS